MWMVVSSLLCLCTGIAIGFLARWIYAKSKLTSAEQSAERIVAEAEQEAEARSKEIVLETRDRLLKEQQQNERENRERRSEIRKAEVRLEQKEENLERRQQEIDELKRKNEEEKENLSALRGEMEEDHNSLRQELEKVAGLSREEAKNLVIEEMRSDAEKDGRLYVEKIERETKQQADKIARAIIVTSIQRVAAEVSGEATAASVTLSSDDMKGKIIGREGRNIRALETLTGVDIIIDDTPGAVVVSCFDPVRREIAKIALDRLLTDGRIHPIRIEEVVDKVSKEVEKIIMSEGESVAFDLGFHNMSQEMIRALGRLHYRTSYGQNVLEHSKEVAILAGMIASEVGADSKLAMRGGLLHDIGKGIETESEDGHAVTGAELAKRLGESVEVVNCIESHHGDTEPDSLEAVIVQIADAISASRPGARRESLENYIKRLENLENIAKSFEGVSEAYAVQAGRELRILVDSKKVPDENIAPIAKGIAGRIETELRYPGKIRITIIRETRVTEYAR